MLTRRMAFRWSLLSAAIALLGARMACATEFSTQDYDLYAGDFNGDGKTDLLYIGKSPDKPSGIALADANGIPQLGAQSWPSTYLNIPWSDGSYKAVIGDFNHDGCADILLQPQSSGTVYVLLATCSGPNAGQFQGIAQAIPQTAFGIDWSAAQHRVQAADFAGLGFTGLFFQSTTVGGTNAIVLTDSAHGTTGNLFCLNTSSCWTGAPQQTWTDGYQGFKWSTQAAVVTVGDFNGDHKSDLLVQTRPTIVMIDYDVPFPVPKYAAQSFGIFLGQTPDSSGAIIRTPNQLWNVNGLNAQWSPINSTVVVGDFNGDGYMDVLLQSKSPSRPNVLLAGSASGVLSSATSVASNVGSWPANSYQLLVGKFGNSGVAVVYGQATSASGSNFYSSNISSGTVTTTTSTIQIAAVNTAPATGVGVTAASAAVSASGTAQYSIPLQLSPGTAGMTPQLGLQYQHSGKNGLLGVGWGLSGLSVITRCPMTIAQDSLTQGVQGVTADQYCLDGNRLRKTSPAIAQGADGSTYQTELEVYSQITAHGTGTNGPLWFEVKRKDGQTYEYGNSADSRINATSGPLVGTRVWALNAIRDRAKNYIAFSYFNDSNNPVGACQETSSHGSYRLCQILYTGNTSQSTTPPYTVQFIYGSRNTGEVLTHNYLGQTITEVNRLQQIQLQYAGSLVRTWTLTYDPTVTPSHLSRLAAVQECGTNSSCFPATTFAWSNQAMSGSLPAVSATATPDNAYAYLSTSGTPYCVQPWSIDLDGDGIPDTLVDSCTQTPANPGTFTVYWGTAKGQTPRAPFSFSYTNTTTTASTSSTPAAINTGAIQIIGVTDVDGDGKQDFLFVNQQTSALWWIHQGSNGNPYAEPAPITAAGGILLGAFVDVNGDGYPDIVYAQPTDNTHLYVTLHNSDGTAGFQSTSTVAWTAPTGTTILPAQFTTGPEFVPGYRTQLTAMDVDGDGRQDVAVITNNGWYVIYSNGSGFTTGDLIASWSSQAPVAIDINGDGCTDFVYPKVVSGSTPTWQIALSKCGFIGGSGLNAAVDTGLAAPNGIVPAGTSNWGPQFSVVDLNGDGYQDLVYVQPNTAISVVAYSLGTSFAAPVSIGNNLTLWSDRDGDGLPDQVNENYASGSQILGAFNSAVGPKPDLLLEATDGFGNAATFTYEPQNGDSALYTRGSGHTGATQDLDGPMYVVKQLQSTDGIGGTYSLTYAYGTALRNVQGRGFLGFGTRRITDSRTGFVAQETYNQTIGATGLGWEKVGTLAESKVVNASGYVVSDTVNDWESINPDSDITREYVYLRSSTVSTYELSQTPLNAGQGPLLSTTVRTTTIDNYGTPYNVSVVTTEGGASAQGLHPGSSRTQQQVMSSVMNDITDWCLSKPTVVQTTNSHTLADGGTVTHTMNETWDGPHCRVTDKNLEVGSGAELDTHYDYDAYNNIADEVVGGSNLTSRTSYFYYASTTPGHFLTQVKNALSQISTFTWDDAHGVRKTATDPNLLVTSWDYDDFGRQVHELRPDGTGARRTYSPCNVATNFCGDNLLRYMVQDDERNTSDGVISYQYVFFDSLARVKYDETLGFSGALSVVETLYDGRGNLVDKSMPYYEGTDTYKGTSFTYDLYNRVTQTQRPTSDSNPSLTTTQTTYKGLTVTQTDALAHTHTQIADAWGDTIQAVDAAGNATNYTFDAFSHLKSTTDASATPNVATVTYNVRGFKASSNDPDLGAWTYTYDALGEMLTQVDNKGQSTQFQYDVLGRLKNRTDPGATSPDTVWNWDTAANGIGEVGSVTGPLGFSESYTFDTSGRLNSDTTTAVGTTYAINYGFDPLLGKLQTITYPASPSIRFEVWYDYQNGYVKDVKDYTGGVAGTVFWQAVAQDARGHVIQETLGNTQQSYVNFDETNGLINYLQTGPGGGTATQNLNYAWDAVGNLLSRQDVNQSLTESFTYDPLDRLQSVALNGVSTLSMAYDAIGNISSKSDVGTTSHTYNYITAQTGCTYTGLPTQPHAVRNAGGNVYCYDADGNMISRSGGTVGWTPYNLPLTITQGGGNSSTFTYGPDRSRYRQQSVNGTTTEDRTYVGGLFEKLTSSALAAPEYRHYIVANGVKVAIKVLSAAPRNDVLYLHDDHLGGTDVITNAAGTVLIRESNDAWGHRRGSAWTGSPSTSDWSTINVTTHIGYTAQEDLDNLSLVDLNGRVYDPVVARFMSADPYVQAPFESQSLNRYSYTWNNPLNRTDPTGFCTGFLIDSFCSEYNGVDPDTSKMSLNQYVNYISHQVNNARFVEAPLQSAQNGAAGFDPSRLSFEDASEHRRSDSLPLDGDAVLKEVYLDYSVFLGVYNVGQGEFHVDDTIGFSPSPQFLNYLNATLGGFSVQMQHATQTMLNNAQSDLVQIGIGEITGAGIGLGIKAAAPFIVRLLPFAREAVAAAKTIRWSSRGVKEAAAALERGATDISVASRAEAEELFLGRYQGAGYRNTTGMSPREAKEFFGGKAGTYHWDIGEAAYPHEMSHLQIHTMEGPVVRISFPD